jgi:defect-in-organelle-trafficking protein DotB
MASPWSNWPFLIGDILEKKGQSASQDARRAWEAGQISEETLLAVEGGA